MDILNFDRLTLLAGGVAIAVSFPADPLHLHNWLNVWAVYRILCPTGDLPAHIAPSCKVSRASTMGNLPGQRYILP